MQVRRIRGASIGSYPPRQCGIATYTAALSRALMLATSEDDWHVVAMNDRPEGYEYPAQVSSTIRQDEREDYVAAARRLNAECDVALLQHEYGIFGGEPVGNHVLAFLTALEIPSITTLHTVRREPTNDQKLVLQRIVELSDRVVVPSELGIEYLRELYGASPDKLVFIPHGIPAMPFVRSDEAKRALGFTDRTVLMTTGFLSPDKGLELAVEALPRIVEQDPSALYVIVGVTHPNLRRSDGEGYRESLQRRIAALGMGEHVIFVNQFLRLSLLNQYLDAADIYVVPHPSPEQIVSGTLSHALGAGKAIVSTRFEYATDVLADGRGVLVGFRDPDAIADAVVELLRDATKREAMRAKAYQYSRTMLWSNVAERYLSEARHIERKRPQ